MAHDLLPELTLFLPQGWWWIPLESDNARNRAIDQLVDRQFNGVDDQPILKREARRKLLAQALQAHEAGGRVMAISLMTIAGLPISASMTIYMVRVPHSIAGKPAEPLEVVVTQLPDVSVSADESAETRDIAEVDAGPVLRRVYEYAAVPTEIAENSESVIADYWIPVPGGGAVGKITFATPMTTLREPLLGVFDAVVSTAAWAERSRDAPVA